MRRVEPIIPCKVSPLEQRRNSTKEAGTTILLAGFKDRDGGRHFSFERVAADRTRTPIVVDADIALARKHNIRLQELPLLCVQMLESLDDVADRDAMTLTEDHMRAIQASLLASTTIAKLHKQTRPASAGVGQAWRKPIVR